MIKKFKLQTSKIKILVAALAVLSVLIIKLKPPATLAQTTHNFFYVFLTSQKYTGDLVTAANNLGLNPGNGLAAADKICKYLADNSAIADMHGRYWRAWMSDRSTSAYSRFTTKATVPYKLPDTNLTTVAQSWTDLTDGSLQNTIIINENGTANPYYGYEDLLAWTNTYPSGDINTANTAGTNSCLDWTTSTWVSGSNNFSMYGDIRYTDPQWTNSGYYYCASRAHFYCFEQLAPPSLFSNLSFTNDYWSANFSFSYANTTSNYIVDVSTDPTMATNVISAYGQGTASPISVTDTAKLNQLPCGQTFYWKVYNADRSVSSSIQSANLWTCQFYNLSFSNRYSSFHLNSDEFSIPFSWHSPNFIVDVSKDPTMATNVISAYGQGTASPISVTDTAKLNQLPCGQTFYWRVYNADRTVSSPIQTAPLPCQFYSLSVTQTSGVINFYFSYPGAGPNNFHIDVSTTTNGWNMTNQYLYFGEGPGSPIRVYNPQSVFPKLYNVCGGYSFSWRVSNGTVTSDVQTAYGPYCTTYTPPTTASCGDATWPRAEGLVTASSLTPDISGHPKFGTTAGVCIVDSKAAFAPYKIPAYEDLKSIYFDQSSSARKTTISSDASDTNINSAVINGEQDRLISVNGNLTTSSTFLPSSIYTNPPPVVIFVSGNLNIQNYIKYASSSRRGGLVFVVKGDINIDPTVTEIDAVLISNGTIYTAGPGCTTSLTPAPKLTIMGGLISLNDNTDTSRIKFCRSLGTRNSDTPAEVIAQDPKYLVILKDILAPPLMKWSEIGP